MLMNIQDFVLQPVKLLIIFSFTLKLKFNEN